ncbi:putative uncharacterized protein encoded by ZNF503-AS2 [Canis lupus dingo]|uniref:putative uncharacterized protein encoded by ZNF503-AS2 n=1 Tax=Canis lupus dingo TaxID=286419 RepID=UPI000DC68E68|nr:putative uncharacterized protein encoded by ZNF503-AS2 [Canis lupus dingo]
MRNRIEGVTRRRSGGSPDNGPTFGSRGAQGTHTPNTLSRSVTEISRGAAAWNRRDFSAVCASRIRINAARRHPAGNGSRFECMQTHRPSAGREVAPGDLAAAGPASKGDWAVSALRPGAAPCCPAVPGSPHPWGGVCFGNPPGGVRPRQKLKANAEAKEARTFFDATLPQRSGGDLGRTARWCVRARKVGAPPEGGLGRPSLARGETLGKAPPLPYFSPTPRPPSVKK